MYSSEMKQKFRLLDVVLVHLELHFTYWSCTRKFATEITVKELSQPTQNSRLESLALIQP